ncbi:5-hydroxyisourate hydrolase-like isoform X2 [Macrobrachium nipponense]|uniref:5-hydroxyisourate hydrolase-like isoform X2 n=1 Tax=Macrobrachium nipponense TaxID=159736 RepID=UPI0030C8BACE
MAFHTDRLGVLTRHLHCNKALSNGRDSFVQFEEVSKGRSKVDMAGNPITCHVLDTATGKPASSMKLSLHKQTDAGWEELVSKATNSDGRAGQFLSQEAFTKGVYKMFFDTADYFKQQNTKGFYPYVEIVFEIEQPAEHYHIPLLLSPYGYSTYRGS